jgi:hypothetical protein
MLGGMHEINVTFQAHMADTDFRDEYINGTSKAYREVRERDDITIGTSSHPSVTIEIPYMTPEERGEDRPEDGTVTENLTFHGHVIDDSDPLYRIKVVNTIESY